MAKTIFLVLIRVVVSFNLLYGAICYKLAGVPFSIALFTTMSHAVHGVISQPVFRIGTGLIELIAAFFFLIPKTARLGAAIIAVYMLAGPILSHLLILGYGWAFADALATFTLPCIYLWWTRSSMHDDVHSA